MINQLEMGDAGDTFGNLAKQFYEQNLQIKSSSTAPVHTSANKQSVLISNDGSMKDVAEIEKKN